jgi:hypothetical protein
MWALGQAPNGKKKSNKYLADDWLTSKQIGAFLVDVLVCVCVLCRALF